MAYGATRLGYPPCRLSCPRGLCDTKLTCILGKQRFLRRAHRRLLNSQAFMLHVVQAAASSGSADVWLRRVPEDILRQIHVLSLRA